MNEAWYEPAKDTAVDVLLSCIVFVVDPILLLTKSPPTLVYNVCKIVERRRKCCIAID